MSLTASPHPRNQSSPPECTVKIERFEQSHSKMSSGVQDQPSNRLHISESRQPQHLRKLTRETTRSSIAATYGSSLSPSLSSLSSASVSSTVENEARRVSSPRPFQRSLRKRPGVSDLQRYQSVPGVLLEESPKQRADQGQNKSVNKRSRSAGPKFKDQAKFVSPDRYIAIRSSPCTPTSPIRTSHAPSLLSAEERLNRNTRHVNVFRSASEGRMPQTVSRPPPNRSRPFQPPHYTPSFVNDLNSGRVRRPVRTDVSLSRQISPGSVWDLGGWIPAPLQLHGVDLGDGSTIASGSNAPMVNSRFLVSESADEHLRRHEKRVAFALGIDTASRVLPFNRPMILTINLGNGREEYQWLNGGWTRGCSSPTISLRQHLMLRPEKVVPAVAFRVLDAPRLKDDYYCSVLAYCRPFRTLAVALAHRVYLWTERHGVRFPPLAPARQTNYVTSIAFSSDEGRKAILAVSRYNGNVTLWSLLDRRSRFEIPHPSAACSVAFRPKCTRRISTATGRMTYCEDLLVGDDSGCINYYSVEWPEHRTGSVTLLTKIEAHSQNVCGLAWAPHGESFVSGGNDNNALLFEIEDLSHIANIRGISTDLPDSCSPLGASNSITDIQKPALFNVVEKHGEVSRAAAVIDADQNHQRVGTDGPNTSQLIQGVNHDRGRSSERAHALPQNMLPTPPYSPSTGLPSVRNDSSDMGVVRTSNVHRYSFYHSAAVKALAFAPWQPTLLATRGGSNDKQIHFHHTETGTTLAVINVFAQVTSLAWSFTRREIVATFGYAQPEHAIRIAVFAWPSCECVMSIPWERKANGEIGRALWAISYPGGPNDAAPERLQDAMERQQPWGPRNYVGLPGIGQDWIRRSHEMLNTPRASPTKNSSTDVNRARYLARGEGETWASRTEEEGSLIVACCDQTVKFFEVWAGKSKGKTRGLGSKAGVFGGSKVLEGWCEGIAIEEIGAGEDVIQ